MRNDQELLELAAKAAGITLRYNYLGTQNANDPWLPLTDDGDALRLAAKCNVLLNDEVVIAAAGNDVEELRRAIVRAAASIGEQMK